MEWNFDTHTDQNVVKQSPCMNYKHSGIVHMRMCVRKYAIPRFDCVSDLFRET